MREQFGREQSFDWGKILRREDSMAMRAPPVFKPPSPPRDKDPNSKNDNEPEDHPAGSRDPERGIVNALDNNSTEEQHHNQNHIKSPGLHSQQHSIQSPQDSPRSNASSAPKLEVDKRGMVSRHRRRSSALGAVTMAIASAQAGRGVGKGKGGSGINKRRFNISTMIQKTFLRHHWEAEAVKQEWRMCQFSMIALFFAIIEQEFIWYTGFTNNRRNWHSAISNFLKVMITLFDAVLVYSLFVYYKMLAKFNESMDTSENGEREASKFTRWRQRWFGARNKVGTSTVLLMPKTWLFVPELFISVLQPVPFWSITTRVRMLGIDAEYRVESFFVMIMVLRIYQLMRYFRDKAAVNYKQGAPTLAKHGITLSTQFLIKRALHTYPGKIIAAAAGVCILVTAYLLRLGEIGLAQDFPEHIYFWNNLWLIMTTVTTVGFGDTFPRSHIGRAVCSVAMIVSMCIIALMTAALTRILAFSKLEERLSNNIEMELQDQGFKHAACGLMSAWYLDLKDPTFETRQEYIQKLSLFRSLRLKRVRAKLSTESDSRAIATDVGRKLENLMGKLESMAKKPIVAQKMSGNQGRAHGSAFIGQASVPPPPLPVMPPVHESDGNVSLPPPPPVIGRGADDKTTPSGEGQINANGVPSEVFELLRRIESRMDTLENKMDEMASMEAPPPIDSEEVAQALSSNQIGQQVSVIRRAVTRMYKSSKEAPRSHSSSYGGAHQHASPKSRNGRITSPSVHSQSTRATSTRRKMGSDLDRGKRVSDGDSPSDSSLRGYKGRTTLTTMSSQSVKRSHGESRALHGSRPIPRSFAHDSESSSSDDELAAKVMSKVRATRAKTPSSTSRSLRKIDANGYHASKSRLDQGIFLPPPPKI